MIQRWDGRKKENFLIFDRHMGKSIQNVSKYKNMMEANTDENLHIVLIIILITLFVDLKDFHQMFYLYNCQI